MKNLIITLLFMFVLSSCKNNKKSNENKKSVTEVGQTIKKSKTDVISENKGYSQLDKNLSHLVNEYSKDYPIKAVEEVPENVHQSYYVSFFKVGDDTIMALCRQPYLMEVFPEFAFDKSETPKEKPEYMGMVENGDLPIFIFDSEGVGNGFYGNTALAKEYPEKYLTNEGKSHAPEIPPIYKYIVQNGDFKFLSKSESQWID
ncbi:MAG: hypothetical protein AAF600_20950 [Bacteroidota bacterium]